jgi:hypothetical protein
MVAPGFNANYLLRQPRHIVEETSVFVDILREHAGKGDMFSLDELTSSPWISLGLCFNSKPNSQRAFDPLAAAMRRQAIWKLSDPEFNVFHWNIARPFVQR